MTYCIYQLSQSTAERQPANTPVKYHQPLPLTLQILCCFVRILSFTYSAGSIILEHVGATNIILTMSLKAYKDLIKEKTIEAVESTCKQMDENSLPTDDWFKVFNKTNMKELLKTEDAEILARLSSAFWKQDVELWEAFLQQFLSIKKLHKTKFLNDMIRHGDERTMAMLQRLVQTSSIRVSGAFDDYGQVELESHIDLTFAKKLATYPGPITLYCGNLDKDAAGVLANRFGAIDPGYLGYVGYGDDAECDLPLESPEFLALMMKICDDMCGTDLYLHMQELTPDIATIISGFQGTIRLCHLNKLTPGVVAALARFSPDPGDYLEIILEDDDFRPDPEITPGALAEFHKYRGELQLRIGRYKMSDAEAEALGQLERLSLTLCDAWPELDQLDVIIQNKQKLDFWFYEAPELAIPVAEILSKCEGELYINGLGSLSDESAKILSRLGSKLKLANVSNISDSACGGLRDAAVDLAYCGSA